MTNVSSQNELASTQKSNFPYPDLVNFLDPSKDIGQVKSMNKLKKISNENCNAASEESSISDKDLSCLLKNIFFQSKNMVKSNKIFLNENDFSSLTQLCEKITEIEKNTAHNSSSSRYKCIKKFLCIVMENEKIKHVLEKNQLFCSVLNTFNIKYENKLNGEKTPKSFSEKCSFRKNNKKNQDLLKTCTQDKVQNSEQEFIVPKSQLIKKDKIINITETENETLFFIIDSLFTESLNKICSKNMSSNDKKTDIFKEIKLSIDSKNMDDFIKNINKRINKKISNKKEKNDFRECLCKLFHNSTINKYFQVEIEKNIVQMKFNQFITEPNYQDKVNTLNDAKLLLAVNQYNNLIKISALKNKVTLEKIEKFLIQNELINKKFDHDFARFIELQHIINNFIQKNKALKAELKESKNENNLILSSDIMDIVENAVRVTFSTSDAENYLHFSESIRPVKLIFNEAIINRELKGLEKLWEDLRNDVKEGLLDTLKETRGKYILTPLNFIDKNTCVHIPLTLLNKNYPQIKKLCLDKRLEKYLDISIKFNNEIKDHVTLENIEQAEIIVNLIPNKSDYFEDNFVNFAQLYVNHVNKEKYKKYFSEDTDIHHLASYLYLDGDTIKVIKSEDREIANNYFNAIIDSTKQGFPAFYAKYMAMASTRLEQLKNKDNFDKLKMNRELFLTSNDFFSEKQDRDLNLHVKDTSILNYLTKLDDELNAIPYEKRTNNDIKNLEKITELKNKLIQNEQLIKDLPKNIICEKIKENIEKINSACIKKEISDIYAKYKFINRNKIWIKCLSASLLGAIVSGGLGIFAVPFAAVGVPAAVLGWFITTKIISSFFTDPSIQVLKKHTISTDSKHFKIKSSIFGIKNKFYSMFNSK